MGPLCYERPGHKRPKPLDYQKILSISVLDPAMGGGRFLFAAVEYLARALADSRGENISQTHRRQVAGHCIYGVDQDPMAVDLARAGMWLYLGGPEVPWDYLRKHLQSGDALMGASLEEMDNEPAAFYADPNQLTLFKQETSLNDLTPLKQIAGSGRLKHRLEALADLWTSALLEDEDAREEYPLVRLSLPHASEDRWSELEGHPGFQQARQLASKMKFFHWEMRFNEVFSAKREDDYGFDAVIGNPPYRRERGSGADLALRHSPIARRWGEGKMDLLALFIHRGLDLLKPSGKMAFIASSYWLKAEGASKLRDRMVNEERFKLFVDLADVPVFEGLSGRHGILLVERGARHPHPFRVMRLRNEKTSRKQVLESLLENPSESFAQEEILDQRDLLDESGIFNLSDRTAERICRKMERNGVDLGDLAKTSQGIVDNPPALTARMIAAAAERRPELVEEQAFEAGEAVFLLPPGHPLISSLTGEERDFLRPFYRAASIRKYCLPQKPDGYLIYLTPGNCHDIAAYPWLREHLERYRVFTQERREVKDGSIKWWHLHWPRDEAFFETEHILLPQMGESVRCARAEGSAYAGMSVQVIVPKKGIGCGFLTAVLNSRAVEFYLAEGGHAKERGAGVDITLQTLRRIPIPQIPAEKKSDPQMVEELMNAYRDWVNS